ncbi:MAG TPA: DUF6062 family protein [Bacteroidales bacterium]|nr:DUF6062 family protein [Bacteroidales bacterium]
MQTQPDHEKLRLYSEAKLTLANHLRVMREAFTSMGRASLERQCGELMARLAEDRFTLAVIGQFKRGKSSLINAILRKEILPTGVLPLTSAITILNYGPKERIVVEKYNSVFPEELPTEALSDLVTEKGNPGNQKRIKSVRIEFPNSFLRRGIEFVDTPGIGSSILANTTTTYNFLPECDAVLFVTSMETPMTSLELEFLRDIQAFVKKIFFVVNKADLLGDEERGSILRFVTGMIRKEFGSETINIFPVSALSGIKARLTADHELYRKSGIGPLEDALTTFLSDEKMNTFLAAVAQKAIRMLDGEEILGKLKESLQYFNEGSNNSKITEYHRMERHTLLSSKNDNQKTFIGSSFKSKVPDIPSDLDTRGCPVCKHMTECAADYFIHWQNKIATDEKAQEFFAAEHGFCPMHTWQLLAVTSPLGASLGFPILADRLAQELQTIRHDNHSAMWIRNLVPDNGNCRICESLRDAETNYLKGLAEYIGDECGLQDYLNSQGVCLHHLGGLAELVPYPDTVKRLISQASEYLQGTSEDMRNYSLKRDALRRYLLNTSEEDAYLRAIVHIYGDRMVCMPWPRDRYI